MIQCGDCKFFSRINFHRDSEESWWSGECRRHAPVAAVVTVMSGWEESGIPTTKERAATWPLVMNDQCCGDGEEDV